MSAITNISDARVKFLPTIKNTTDSKPYVQLTVSEYAGKNADGTPHYNEYHLFVWNKYDIELAKSLGVGDRIVVTLERCKICYRIDQNTGKVYPYISGNVCTNSISAIYTNTPSDGLRNYEAAQQQRRDGLKQQNHTVGNELIQQQPAQPQTMQVQATQPVQNFVPVQQSAYQPAQATAPAQTVVQTQPAQPVQQPQPVQVQATQPTMAVATTPAMAVATAPVANAQVRTTTPQTQPPTYQPNQAQATTQPNATQNPGGTVLPEGYEVPF